MVLKRHHLSEFQYHKTVRWVSNLELWQFKDEGEVNIGGQDQNEHKRIACTVLIGIFGDSCTCIHTYIKKAEGYKITM